MKWLCGDKQWHAYFALTPVRIDGVCVWLEWVERRDVGSYDSHYEYRRKS